MTQHEAKQVLLRYREEVSDSSDLEIKLALEVAARNPELNEWLTTHRNFQIAAVDQLRSIPVPPDFKAVILAGKPTHSVLGRTSFLAMAALLVGLAVSAALWFRPPSETKTFANFQNRMMNFVLRTYQMDILSTDQAKVREYLAAHGAPSDYALTPALSRLPVKGGGRLSWQNHPVGMICFDLPQKETLYLFVVDRAVIPDSQVPDKRSLVTPGARLSTATWSDGQRIYMLAAPIDAEALAKLAERNG
ncbi:MAG: hypothetical protein JWM99_2939 [Verrucomicrobiales bacterium]|nr:hypothetical protein [Verrucomicrobiales bacterium]